MVTATLLPSEERFHLIELYRVGSQELNAIVSYYRSPELDVVWRFLVDKDRLMLKRQGFPDTVTEFASKDEISIGGADLVLERKGDVISGFRISAGRVKNLLFAKRNTSE